MKSLVVTSLTLAVLTSGAIASHAVAFTMFVENVDPLTLDATANDYSSGYANPLGIGVNGGNPGFHSVFTPDNSGAPHVYTSPTVVRYGDVTTFGPTGNGVTGTFNSVPAAFDFALEDGADPGGVFSNPFNQFLVKGTLGGIAGNPSGTIGQDSDGIPFSTAAFTVTEVRNITDGTTAIVATNPATDSAAFYIQAKLSGKLYNLYINRMTMLPSPGTSSFEILGYVTTGTHSLAGSIQFPDSIFPSEARNGVFQFRDPTGTQLLFTRSVQINETGAYVVPEIPAGRYNVLIHVANFLDKSIVADASHDNVNAGNIELPGGDINNDNIIDIADFGILVNNYRARGDR